MGEGWVGEEGHFFFVFGCLVWFGLGEDVWVWLSRDIVFFLGRFVTVSFRALLVVFLWLVREKRGGGLRKVVFMGKGGGEGLCMFYES